MKGLGLVVSEKKIFLCFSHDAPGAGPVCTPRARLAEIIKEDHYTLLHTKYESSGPCGFGEEDFLCFPYCKSMGANDPWGRAIFDPRGMVGRIYKEDHYTLLHTKYEKSGSCGFREEDFFFMFFPLRPWGGTCMDPRGTVGRNYKEDHYTLLHTKYESFGPCGLGEGCFFLYFSHCKSMGAICCHGNQSSDLT